MARRLHTGLEVRSRPGQPVTWQKKTSLPQEAECECDAAVSQINAILSDLSDPCEVICHGENSRQLQSTSLGDERLEFKMQLHPPEVQRGPPLCPRMEARFDWPRILYKLDAMQRQFSDLSCKEIGFGGD